MSFSRSAGGRILWLAAGLFLACTGLAALLAATKAAVVLGVAGPLAAVLGGMFAVGLSLESHPMAALATTILGPVVLWPAFMLTLVVDAVAPRAGLVLVAMGVACAATAVMLTLKQPLRHLAGAEAH